MKILQVCSYLYPALTYGGPAKMVYDLSIELSKKNSVTIYTTDVWDADKRISSKQKLKSKKNFEVKYFSNLFNGLAYKIRFFTCFGMPFSFFMNSHKFDLVHIHDVFILPQLLVALIAIKFHVPLILTPHGVLDPVRLKKKNIVKTILMPIVTFCLKRADTVVAVSKKEAKDLEKIGFKNVELVWNGIPRLEVKPSKKFKRFKKKEALTLLYVGKIHPQKGIKEALEALSESKLRAQFLIAGPDDGGKEELLDVIEESGLKNIHFLGFVSDKEKKELYNLSHVFIHPSYAEGFSISILEAMQEGLPVVISDGCNFSDVKKYQAGYIATTKDLKKSLKRIFQKISRSKEELSDRGKNGTKLIRNKYTISDMALGNFAIYEKVLQI